MTTIDLTLDTYDAIVGGDGIVLVDFWASWCSPCRRFAPVYARASENHPDVTFAKVDTEAETAIEARVGITAIPTLMIFREGVLLYAGSGALPAAAVEDLIAQARGLEMADVRRALAEA